MIMNVKMTYGKHWSREWSRKEKNESDKNICMIELCVCGGDVVVMWHNTNNNNNNQIRFPLFRHIYIWDTSPRSWRQSIHTLLSFCHEHDPRLSIILHVSSASSPGFTSVYFGCSTNFWSPNEAEIETKIKRIIIIYSFSYQIFMDSGKKKINLTNRR